MRQGQQNRRGRGRNHNHQQRKNQNPLSRSYESNGPDVKLRGTPNHIAEKYLSLARDAQSSGDPVLAENYLQHAEHYNRIIMAYREQNLAQGGGDPSLGGNGEFGEGFSPTETGMGALDAEGTEEGGGDTLATHPGGGEFGRGLESSSSHFEQQASRGSPDQFRSQYQHQGQRERSFSEGRSGFNERRDRRDRHEGRDRSERRDRQDHRYDRRDRGGERFDRYQSQGGGDARGEGSQRRERNGSDRLPQDAQEQPEFLRRSVRRPRQTEEGGADAASTVAARDKEGSNRE